MNSLNPPLYTKVQPVAKTDRNCPKILNMIKSLYAHTRHNGTQKPSLATLYSQQCHFY